MMDAAIRTGAGDALLNALADRMAPRVAAIVVAQLRSEGFGAPRYATARENPCGSRKAFLRGCRLKAFRSFKRGRAKAALWGEVEAWWREESVAPATNPHEDEFKKLKQRVGRRKGRSR